MNRRDRLEALRVLAGIRCLASRGTLWITTIPREIGEMRKAEYWLAKTGHGDDSKTI